MENKYEFGVGSINDVCNKNIETVDTLDEIGGIKQTGTIIIPKVIGIYQRNKDIIDELYNSFGELLNLFESGKKEKIDSNLISVLYDPTIITEDIVKTTISEKDMDNRIKIQSYSDFNEDFLYEKGSGKLEEVFSKTIREPNEENLALLDNKREVLDLMKRDFGLTRKEALLFSSLKKLLNDHGKYSKIDIN